MLTNFIFACIACMLFTQDGWKESRDNITIEIYHYKMPCAGESVRLCYLIKKKDGKKELMYDEIEGFHYQWGYNYTLSVEKKPVKNQMADASSFSYKLKKIIKKDKVPDNETFELPLRMDDQSLIENKNGKCSYFGAIDIETGANSCKDLVKAKAGIFKHGSNGKSLVVVKVKL